MKARLESVMMRMTGCPDLEARNRARCSWSYSFTPALGAPSPERRRAGIASVRRLEGCWQGIPDGIRKEMKGILSALLRAARHHWKAPFVVERPVAVG
jgi:hypothetical protein